MCFFAVPSRSDPGAVGHLEVDFLVADGADVAVEPHDRLHSAVTERGGVAVHVQALHFDPVQRGAVDDVRLNHVRVAVGRSDFRDEDDHGRRRQRDCAGAAPGRLGFGFDVVAVVAARILDRRSHAEHARIHVDLKVVHRIAVEIERSGAVQRGALKDAAVADGGGFLPGLRIPVHAEIRGDPEVPPLLVAILVNLGFRGRIIFEISGILGQPGENLLQIVRALGFFAGFPGALQGGQQHGGQNCDDRNDHKDNLSNILICSILAMTRKKAEGELSNESVDLCTAEQREG